VTKIVGGIALILLVAFVGSRRTFTRLPMGARLFFLTGTEYIFVGFALGGRMTGVLDDATVRSLSPLFSLGLGTVGLILGIQLEAKKLAGIPARYFRMTAVQALVTMLVVFPPAFLFLRAHLVGSVRAALPGALVLATTAACTSQAGLALLVREYGLRRTRVLELLRYLSSLDAVMAVTVFGFAFCLLKAHPLLGFDLGTSVQWFALSLALGAAMGCFLHLLTGVRCTEGEMLIFVVGTVVFAAGIASWLGISPLLVSMFAGITATNLPGSKTRILNLLARLEKPFYVTFLVLAGAVWLPGSAWAVPLAALYVALRLAGKLGGGYLAGRISSGTSSPPPLLGLGLVSQGGVVIAMVMSYYRRDASPDTPVVVTAVLLAVVVSELIGPPLALGLLRRSGEVGT
jgi:Kef-type K+ transport system membrane component KefB